VTIPICLLASTGPYLASSTSDCMNIYSNYFHMAATSATVWQTDTWPGTSAQTDVKTECKYAQGGGGGGWLTRKCSLADPCQRPAPWLHAPSGHVAPATPETSQSLTLPTPLTRASCSAWVQKCTSAEGIHSSTHACRTSKDNTQSSHPSLHPLESASL